MGFPLDWPRYYLDLLYKIKPGNMKAAGGTFATFELGHNYQVSGGGSLVHQTSKTKTLTKLVDKV